MFIKVMFLRKPSILKLQSLVLNSLESRAPYLTTSSDEPAKFGPNDVGKLYSLPRDLIEPLNVMHNLPPDFKKQVQTLRECVWLYREQTNKAFNYLREIDDAQRPALRMVLWGKFGTGKTMTLCQLIHFAHLQGFIIFSVVDVMKWTRDNYYEIQMSVYKPGRVNSPWWATRLLKNFKLQNQLMWDKIARLKTTKHYKWSQVENTPEGKPVTDIVEMGLTAPYLATDCVGALGRELRAHASSGSIKLLVAIDKANSLYGKTVVKRADRKRATSDELALNIHMRKFLMPIWSNGLCTMIADKADISDSREMLSIPVNDPRSLFGERGFEQIQPFVPVETKLYSVDEFETIHDYYLEKKWLHQEDGPCGIESKRQMMFLSALNPFHYERLCARTWRLGCTLPIFTK